MRGTAGIRGVADDLAGIVDAEGIRDGEAGVGGGQRIEIDQRAVIVDEADDVADYTWEGENEVVPQAF